LDWHTICVGKSAAKTLQQWMHHSWGPTLSEMPQKEENNVRFCDGPPKCSFSGQQNQFKKWWWVLKSNKEELKANKLWKKKLNFTKKTKDLKNSLFWKLS
jgi:hypothetical protein